MEISVFSFFFFFLLKSYAVFAVHEMPCRVFYVTEAKEKERRGKERQYYGTTPMTSCTPACSHYFSTVFHLGRRWQSVVGDAPWYRRMPLHVHPRGRLGSQRSPC